MNFAMYDLSSTVARTYAESSNKSYIGRNATFANDYAGPFLTAPTARHTTAEILTSPYCMSNTTKLRAALDNLDWQALIDMTAGDNALADIWCGAMAAQFGPTQLHESCLDPVSGRPTADAMRLDSVIECMTWGAACVARGVARIERRDWVEARLAEVTF